MTVWRLLVLLLGFVSGCRSSRVVSMPPQELPNAPSTAAPTDAAADSAGPQSLVGDATVDWSPESVATELTSSIVLEALIANKVVFLDMSTKTFSELCTEEARSASATWQLMLRRSSTRRPLCTAGSMPGREGLISCVMTVPRTSGSTLLALVFRVSTRKLVGVTLASASSLSDSSELLRATDELYKRIAMSGCGE